MKHLLPLILLLAAVLLTAGCIASEHPANQTPAPAAPGTTPAPAVIPENDIIGLDVLTVYRGADAMQELATSGFSTTPIKEGNTAYLIEVTITCDTLGKHSRREGYLGSVTVSDHDLLLSVKTGTTQTTYPATHLLPVPEKYHKKMLYDDIVLREGESVTGWVLYTNIPEGDAALTMPGFEAENVRI